MLALLCVYTLWQYRAQRRKWSTATVSSVATAGAEVPSKETTPRLLRPILTLICGLIGVGAGSHLLVTGAIGLAREFGVSEAIIGLTLVALGTSLPELSTTVAAAFRRHTGLALGNVVGSSIFNILGILGLAPLFGTLPIPVSIATFDLWVMLGASLVFVAWTTTQRTLGRCFGAILILAYGAYLARHYFALSP